MVHNSCTFSQPILKTTISHVCNLKLRSFFSDNFHDVDEPLPSYYQCMCGSNDLDINDGRNADISSCQIMQHNYPT